MLLPLALLSSALAGPHITSVGPQVELEVAGTWGRVIPTEEGWMYTFSRSNDYWVAPLERSGDAWDLILDGQIQLTDHGDLKDHAIRICPDGTYLHTASLNLDEPNDSAYVYRYDGDWNPIGDAVIEEREPTRRHNDMPLLCSSVFTGTAFSGSGDAAGFFRINDDLSSERVAGLPREANSTGASMLADKDRGVFEFITTSVEGDLIRFTFDQDFNVVDQRSTPIAEGGGEITYWPQSALKVGDYYVVAVMSRQASWSGDDGDIILIVLGEDWNDLYQRVNVTNNPEDNLGMRPWIARKGSTLLVSYDRQREHTVIEVGLDLTAFGLEPGEDDTGWGSGQPGSDGGSDGSGDGSSDGSGDSGEAASDAGGCGCAATSTGGGGLAFALGLLGLARRRA